MEPELRLRVERKLPESLQWEDYLTRERAIFEVGREKPTPAVPLLRERAARLRAEIEAGGRPPQFEPKWLAGSSEALEEFP